MATPPKLNLSNSPTVPSLKKTLLSMFLSGTKWRGDFNRLRVAGYGRPEQLLITGLSVSLRFFFAYLPDHLREADSRQ